MPIERSTLAIAEGRKVVVQKYCIWRAALQDVESLVPFGYDAARKQLTAKFTLERHRVEVPGIDIFAPTDKLDEIIDTAVAQIKREVEQRRRVRCRITRGLTNDSLTDIVLPPEVGDLPPDEIVKRVQGAFADLGEG